MLDRRTLAALAVCVILGACRSTPPPNVVIVLVDTLRPDYLGCYGQTSGLTPFVDDVAGRGTRFTHAYAASSWTEPVGGVALHVALGVAARRRASLLGALGSRAHPRGGAARARLRHGGVPRDAVAPVGLRVRAGLRRLGGGDRPDAAEGHRCAGEPAGVRLAGCACARGSSPAAALSPLHGAAFPVRSATRSSGRGAGAPALHRGRAGRVASAREHLAGAFAGGDGAPRRHGRHARRVPGGGRELRPGAARARSTGSRRAACSRTRSW